MVVYYGKFIGHNNNNAGNHCGIIGILSINNKTDCKQHVTKISLAK